MVDEAHHLWPATWGLVPTTIPQRVGETVLITMRPAELAPPILRMIDLAIAVGPGAADTLAAVAAGRDRRAAPMPATRLRRGEVLAWFLDRDAAPVVLETVPARSSRLRHLRKYAEGNLGLSRRSSRPRELSAEESRRLVRDAIERRYTLPG